MSQWDGRLLVAICGSSKAFRNCLNFSFKKRLWRSFGMHKINRDFRDVTQVTKKRDKVVTEL